MSRQRSRRTWTAREQQWLRAHYRTLGRKECARILQRSPQAVACMVLRLGLTRPCLLESEVEGPLRRFAGLGLADDKIAEELAVVLSAPWNRKKVFWWRRRLGIPARPNPWQGTGKANCRRTCQATGARNFAQVRCQSEAVRAAFERGWPQARTLRQADLLDALVAEPRTAQELALALYGRWSPATYRNTRGLLRALGDAIEVSGPRPYHYSLAAGVTCRRPSQSEEDLE